MFSPINRFNFSDKQLIRWLTLLSALIAIRIIYIQHGWINDDSVLYFEVARLFSLGDWKAGIQLYNWSFYSALLAGLYQVSHWLAIHVWDMHLSIQNIAQGLNVLLFTLTTYSFLTILRIAGGKQSTLLCGALLLFSSSYIVGDVLPMLMRDEGFWAFFLTSLVFFIQFYRSGRSSHALMWQVSIMMAMLFRVEAICFLLLLPIMLLSRPELAWRQRMLQWLHAQTLTIAAAVVMLSVLIASSTITLKTITDFQLSILFQFNLSKLSESLLSKAAVMASHVLGSYLEDYALLGILLTLAGIIVIKIVSAAGFATIGLLTIRPSPIDMKLAPDVKRILIWAALIAVLNITAMTLSTFILSGRYIIPLAFILMLFGAFPFASLFIKHSGQPQKMWFIGTAIACLLCIFIIRNVWSKSPEYNYEQHAVNFVESSRNKDDRVFYVSPRARYYAGAPFSSRGYDYWLYVKAAIADGTIRNYDFLVINMDNRYPEREKVLFEALDEYTLIKEFNGYKGKKKMLVFSKNAEKPLAHP